MVLFERIEEKIGLSYLFISHDALAVKVLSDHVVIKDKGRVVEAMDTNNMDKFTHPASKEIISSL